MASFDSGMVKALAENRRALFTLLLVIAGVVLILASFFQTTGAKIQTRKELELSALIVGVCLVLASAVLLSQVDLHRKTLVFYAPSIKANSFFAELLEYMVDMADHRKWTFVIEKGESGVGMHEAGNYLEVIRRHSDESSVIIMIPPSPRAFEEIWRLPSNLGGNLITLDMSVPQELLAQAWPKQLKATIRVDNEMGARLAAVETAEFCRLRGMAEVNVVVCEGNFHRRGFHFRRHLELEADGQIKLHFLGTDRILSFSDAIKEARSYVREVLADSLSALGARDTFIFCANDNLSIGARLAIASTAPSVLTKLRPLRLICFDASTVLRAHIDLGDELIWCAVDQNYQRIVQSAVETAADLFDRRSFPVRRILVEPSIYRR